MSDDIVREVVRRSQREHCERVRAANPELRATPHFILCEDLGAGVVFVGEAYWEGFPKQEGVTYICLRKSIPPKRPDPTKPYDEWLAETTEAIAEQERRHG